MYIDLLVKERKKMVQLDNINRKVLLIENSVAMQEIIKTCLKSEGFSICEANCPYDGLESIKKNLDFDLIIVDASNSNLSNLELAIKIRNYNIYKDKPILLLENQSDLKFKSINLSDSNFQIIPKPFNPEEFIYIINHLVSNLESSQIGI